MLKLEEQGRQVPMLEEQPEVWPHLKHIWDAFLDLTKTRYWGFGHPQPITLVEVEVYARLQGVEGEDLVEMVRHLRDMDQKYIEWQATKPPSKEGKSGGGAKGRNRRPPRRSGR